MLSSIRKDSMCMLHVARKAFDPAPVRFPHLHIDSTWNFRAMSRKASPRSERQGRLIDHDDAGSMEKKKREGDF